MLLGLMAGALVLTTLEAGACVVYTARGDAQPREATWYAYSRDLGWTRKPGFKGLEGGYLREFDSQGFFSVDSPQLTDGHTRVLAFGDSNTFGVGAATSETFVEVADRLLSDASVINLGIVGGTSYQGRAALSAYARTLKPDLVVVSYNFNDRRSVRTRDEADGAEHFERLWNATRDPAKRVVTLLQELYLSRSLRSAMRSAHLVADASEVDLATAVPRVDEDDYRRNLQAMAQDTRRLGIPLLFILLKDNPIETEVLDLGIERLSRGDVDGAIETLTAAVQHNNAFSDLARLYLARAYEAAGRAAEAITARRAMHQRTLAGGRPLRRDRDYNRIMREVAAEHGVPVVDGGAVLDERPADYVDFCHFNAAAHKKLGELLARQIVASLREHRHSSQSEPE